MSSYKTCFNINNNFIRIKYKYHYFNRDVAIVRKTNINIAPIKIIRSISTLWGMGAWVGFEFARGMGGWVGLRNGWMGGWVVYEAYEVKKKGGKITLSFTSPGK